jgi:hypothetical protein
VHQPQDVLARPTRSATSIKLMRFVNAAANGDVQAANALIPWIDQALGKPTNASSIGCPPGPKELEQMDEAQLERLVAQGRQARLHAVPEAGSALDG